MDTQNSSVGGNSGTTPNPSAAVRNQSAPQSTRTGSAAPTSTSTSPSQSPSQGQSAVDKSKNLNTTMGSPSKSETSPRQGGQTSPQQNAPAGKDGQQGQQPPQMDVRQFSDDELNAVVEMKVDGKPVQKTLKEWMALSNKGLVSTKMWQEASESRKQAAEYANLRRLREQNPERFAEVMVPPQVLEKMAEKIIAKRLERSMMTEEQRRNVELEEQLQAERGQREEHERQTRAQYIQQFQTQMRTQVDGELNTALEQIGVPVNAFTRGILAHKIFESWESRKAEGLPPLSAAEASANIFDELFPLWQSTFEKLPDEVLLKAIGDRTMDRLNDIRVGRVTPPKGPANDGKRQGNSPSTESRDRNPKPLTEDEWRELHNKLRYGG